MILSAYLKRVSQFLFFNIRISLKNSQATASTTAALPPTASTTVFQTACQSTAMLKKSHAMCRFQRKDNRIPGFRRSDTGMSFPDTTHVPSYEERSYRRGRRHAPMLPLCSCGRIERYWYTSGVRYSLFFAHSPSEWQVHHSRNFAPHREWRRFCHAW